MPLNRFSRGILLGGLLGLAGAAITPRLSVAQATLFFPPPLILYPHSDPDAPTPPVPSSEERVRDPLAWAEDILTSKEALDALCRKIERTSTDDKVEVLRSACLLAEEDRIQVTPREDSYLSFRVAAEKPNVALSLCAGLLAYLTYKTKIPLEDTHREELLNSAKLLRVQERRLEKLLWPRLSYNSSEPSDPNKEQAVELDLLDYQSNIAMARRQARQHFLRETRDAADGPNFVVMEPPFIRKEPRPWLKWGGLGAALGAAAALLSKAFRGKKKPRNFVPWRSQEGANPRRSPAVGGTAKSEPAEDMHGTGI